MTMRLSKLATILAGCALTLIPVDETRLPGLGKPRKIISQKGRSFVQPGIYIGIDEDLHIKNEDGTLVHDAYVASPDFNFESGDINPGETAVIAFPKAGDFMVLCGIHPSMKLAVHVQANMEPRPR